MGKYFNRIVIVLTMLVVVSALGAVSAGAEELNVDFSIPINVSKTAGLSQSATMTLDPGGGIYIAWEERSLELPLFSRSMDGGTTFTEPLALAPSIEDFSYGQLRMASSHPGEIQTVFTVFETYDGWADIVYASSSDGGATFSEPVFISEFDFFNSVTPDIATGWSTAIAWYDNNFETGETAIRYIQSLDGGATFTEPIRLDGAQGQVSCVDVALWGEGSAYAAWPQNDDPYGAIDAWEVFFTRSTDRGETFSTPINISRYSQHSWCPRMAVDGSGTIYLVWAEGNYVTDIKLMFTRSVDGGISFEEPRVLVGPLPSLEPEMSLAASGDGNLWISWMAGDPTVHLDGFFIRSIDGGVTFSPAAPLPGAGGEIASFGPNVVHVVWNEVPQGESWSEIFYSRGVNILQHPPAKIGVFSDGYWYLDTNQSWAWDGTPTDSLGIFGLGIVGAIPVAGDWNSDGRTEIGVFIDGIWYLDMNGNGQWDGEGTDVRSVFGIGVPNAKPVIGDWTGDGKTKIGIYADGIWYLDANQTWDWNGEGPDIRGVFGVGLPNAKPVTGDWNSDSITEIGVYSEGNWYLDNNRSWAWDGTPTDIYGVFGVGLPNVVPVTGDWNGDGTTKIGIYSDGNWYLDKNNSWDWNGEPTDTYGAFGLGLQNVGPVVGNW